MFFVRHALSRAARTAEPSRLQPPREFTSREGSHGEAFFVVDSVTHTIDTPHRRAMFRSTHADCRSKQKRGQAQDRTLLCGF
jgi:hypothetical protein